jgi:putative two-component system response regulator
MKTILAIDDQSFNLVKIEEALEDNYKVLTTTSAERMFEILQKVAPDLILLDIEMPEVNGFEAIRRLKANETHAQIPVIFLTGRTDEISEAQGLKLGAVDFITKPFSKPVLLNRVQMHLNVDGLIRERTAQLNQKEKEVRKIRNGIVRVLSNVVENRDEITGGHIERTSSYTSLLIETLLAKGVYADEIKTWNIAAAVASASLHDVGKVVVSDLILNKPDKLTDEEFAKMKEHVAKGVKIIDQIIDTTGISDSFLVNAKLFAGDHHEKWNGCGYPKGLKGENISLQGRIMAIADVYDALVSDRPYKKAFTHEKAVSIIMEDAGKHFDPKIADVFFEINDKFDDIRKSNL